jgi:cold shock CspA family protein
MQTQPQVSFDDVELTDEVRERLRDEALEWIDQLERFHHRITGCHVVIGMPHRRHRIGGLYSVRVDIVVPEAEIVVNREHHDDHAHEDVFVALRDAFDAAKRRLEDHARRLRGTVKRHEPRGQGIVAKLFPLQGYGFIETPEGREIYFHRHAVENHRFDALDLGSRVRFTEEEGDQGPQASVVEIVHAIPPSETMP